MIRILSYLADVTPTNVDRINNITVSPTSLPRLNANHTSIQSILDIVFGILGAIALVVVVKAGFEYITSAGDPQKAANARNSIIFALVGVIVGISAFAIVTFVINRVN